MNNPSIGSADVAATLPRSPGARKHPAAMLFWTLCALAGFWAAIEFVTDWRLAQSAPQQAAAATFACAMAIIPYVVARAVDQITR